ncbi:tensin-2-like [Lampris incognitus]|uniref:tensin-2-like n=1 Tax=Lampris incognitus TaxID=2546036 RepID=UPI0024B491E4|nr:tensin-2-like [Lampris incognitus]
MGCIHSTRIGRVKKYGASVDPVGVLLKSDSEMSPEVLQIAEVTTTCTSAPDQQGLTKSTSQKKRGSLRRSRSVEQVMEHVMERHYDFDLTYITERIISVFFLPSLEEEQYRKNLQEVATMLKSKHQDKFLLLNLSEKRHDITRLNPKVQDYGWPDLHAPPLDRICAVCKAMETWLTSDPHNVVVLHCKGNKGKTGVIVAAYMHYNKISAGADQALTTLAMRKFCEDKVSSSLQPSQNRYIYYFGGLLSGSIKMNSSPLFLHQILIPSLPNFQAGGGYCPFLKIYQSLQLIYTSGIYDPQSSRARKLCITMEPTLPLKGDIMVKCYHRRSKAAEREVVFRVQFHTCTVHGAQLWFGKTELDVACTDDRFPPDATVECIFSSGPEKTKGRDYRKNDPSIKVDYRTSDPVMRWDSYENFNLHYQDSMENISHTRGPLDGSLYAQVRKRRGPSSGASPNGRLPGSPTVKPQAPSRPLPQTQPLSFSPHSGHSSTPSDRAEEPSPSPVCPAKQETDCLLKRGDARERTRDKTSGKERERETAILDDGELSSPSGLRRECSHLGRSSVRCGEVGWVRERERERDPCLSNGCLSRCNSTKNNPKSRTLPALPSKPMSPPPLSTHMELCYRHSAHPLPELPWEHPTPPLPCLHRPCYPFSTPEHTHPHSHTLPPSNRVCIGDECHLLHYPSHVPSSHLSHQSLPSSPYRELFFSPHQPASSGCLCRECTSRREHQSASVRLVHPLHADESGSPQWTQEVVARQTRDGPPLWGPESPWEMEREEERWQHKSAMPTYRLYHSPLEQSRTLEQPGIIFGPHQGYPNPLSLVDMRDRASSGYHTPPPPRQSCSCSPYQSSPAESHESRGYASGYQSGSASPLPPTSPNPGASPARGGLAGTPFETSNQSGHLTEKQKDGAEDHISQDSTEKSDSSEQSGTPAPDSDHDYTLITSNSPTHMEDSVTEKIVESAPQSSHESSRDTPVPAPLDPNTIGNSTITQTPTKTTTQAQGLNISKDPTLAASGLSQSVSSTSNNDEAKVTVTSNQAVTETTDIIPPSAQPVTPVQMQLNGSALPGDTQSDSNSNMGVCLNPSSSNSSVPMSSPSPIGSSDKPPSPQPSLLTTDPAGQRLTPDRDGTADTKPPSPVPDGYHTPTFPMASYYYPLLNVPHVPYTGYTAVTIPAIQPPLPEKKRLSPGAGPLNGHNSLLRASSACTSPHHVTFSPSVGELPQMVPRGSSCREETDTRVNAKFVQDSSKYWYKPGITRDQAIAVLKDKEPGAFLIRDSNSFQGAYGLALKVAIAPPNANVSGTKGDHLEQLVRHFLIETGPRGVKIKGCQNESYFGSLSALVYQHSITPISLPCALRIPEKDLVGELQEMQSATNTSTAADLLKQGAACNVLYLNSVETESLTGPQAISKATRSTLALRPRPTATVVHFKVSTQGITLTDSKRRLFFRRHYPISSVTFSSVDPDDQRWTNSDCTSSKMFGFVARRTGSVTENVCHLFAEMDPEQPAVAIVNFINKVMLGPQLRR